MKLLSLTSAWLSVAAAVSGYSIDDAGNAEKFPVSAVSGRYIVQLAGSNKPSNAVQSFSDIGYDIQVQHNYDSPVFEGLSFQVSNTNSSTLEDIRSLSWVQEAWEASIVTLIFDPSDANDGGWDTHALTGVDKLHAEGQFGDDIVVGVIDTGVDYNHPAFNGGLGQGSIIGGYDFFVDDLTKPSEDPMDCFGHGTFVSSVIVGNSKDSVGVAPGAKIKMYKVFGCQDSTSEDYIIAGMLQAAADGVDVISLSLGSDRGYYNTPMSLVAAEIAKTIPVVYAAGNSGADGPYRASSGASGHGVIAVGSVEAASLVGWPGIAKSSGGEERTFTYIPEDGERFNSNGTYEVEWTDNICFRGYENSGGNKVIVGNRGLCINEYALTYLEDSKYPVALPVTDDLFYAGFGIPPWYTLQDVGFVNTTFGNWVRDEISAGNTIKIDFNSASVPAIAENPRLNAGQINDYSSWGPTFSNNFYPHVSAPGGHVLGAAIGGGYYVASGTSFACPYVAGIAALYLKANPGTDVSTLKTKLIGATNLMDKFVASSSDEDDFSTLDSSARAPLIQQGAGLVDAYALFEKKVTIVSSPYLELNDTDNRVTAFEITFINEDSSEATFQLSHTPIQAVVSRDPGNLYIYEYFPPTSETYATVEFSQNEITVGAGETATFSVEIVPPQEDNGDGPILQGTIDITGSNGESVRVPYMGIVASIFDWVPFEDKPLSLRFNNENGYYYSLQDSLDYYFDPSKLDSPETIFNIRFGTDFYSFDIVDPDYDLSSYVFPPVPGENGFHGSIMVTPDLDNQNGTFPIEFSQRFQLATYVKFQAYANGTKIPSGQYKILSRALRMFGRRENLDDWQMYLSDVFNVALDGVKPDTSASIEPSAASSSTDSFSSGTLESSSFSTISSQPSASSESESTSEIESSTTPEPTDSDDLELPTASPYKNDATPTGVDVITDIKVYNSISSDQYAYKGDVITIAVTVDVTKNLEIGTTTQFTMPGIFYDDLSAEWPIRLSSTSGMAVAMLENNQATNVWTITFDTQYVEQYNHVYGTFNFNVKLQYSEVELKKRDATETVDLSKPVVLPIVFVTPNEEFTRYLTYGAQPTDAPFKTFTLGETGPTWDVYVPGSIGDIDSFTISGSSDIFWGFDCGSMSASIGTEKDAFGLLLSGSEAEGWTTTCSASTLSGSLTGGVASDETFKLHMTGQMAQDFVFDYTSTVDIEITFSDGTTESFSLYDSQNPNNVGSGLSDVFEGEIRDEVSSANESSTELFSSTAESASASSGVDSGVDVSSTVAEPSSEVDSSVESFATESATSSFGADSSIDVSSIPAVSSAESSVDVTSSSAESSVSSDSESLASESVTIDSSASASGIEFTSSEVESFATESNASSDVSVIPSESSEAVSSFDVSASSISASPSGTLPTLAEEVNSIVPTGLEIITNITIHDSESNSADDVHPDHLLSVAVSIVSTQPIDNDRVQFTVPGVFYDFTTSFRLLSKEGEYVATVNGDEATNVFTIIFDSDWARTHENIRGTFTFDVRLSYSVEALKRRAIDTLVLSGPSIVPVVFTAPGYESTTLLTITSIGNETPATTVGTGDLNVFEGDLVTGSSGTGASTATSSSAALSTATSVHQTVVTITSCSQGSCSQVLSTVSATTHAAETTIVTVTSCSANKCVAHESTALVSTATSTVNGVETVYTTYCPLTEDATTKAAQTVTLTVTSCSNDVCITRTSKAIESAVTTTVNGKETIYTTYAPATTTTTVDKTSTVQADTATTTAPQEHGAVSSGVTGVYASAIKSAQPVVVAPSAVTALSAATTQASSPSTSPSTSAIALVSTHNENSGVSLASSYFVFLLSLFAFIF